MKTIFSLILLMSLNASADTSAFQVSDSVSAQDAQNAEKDCAEAGYNKLMDQAASYGIEVNEGTFTLTGVSVNAVATYYWWSMDITNLNGRTDLSEFNGKLTKLTQKPFLQKCF